jgi:hypothetical protein
MFGTTVAAGAVTAVMSALVKKLFVVANLEYYPNTRLTVYDRWGNKKFETENYSPENTWDGSNSDSGVYYYIIQIPLSPPQTLNGFVHLLR